MCRWHRSATRLDACHSTGTASMSRCDVSCDASRSCPSSDARSCSGLHTLTPACSKHHDAPSVLLLPAQEVKGGAEQLYADAYWTEGLQHPLYQLMASGLTDSTARKVTCNDWRKDIAGLRSAASDPGPTFSRLCTRPMLPSVIQPAPRVSGLWQGHHVLLETCRIAATDPAPCIAVCSNAPISVLICFLVI